MTCRIDLSSWYDDNIIMPRPKKNADVRKGMCKRFVKAMEQLHLNTTEISRELGYSNATTIRKVQRGEAFVDVERLYLFSKLTTPEGEQIDLNWLITGQQLGKRSGPT